MEQNVADSPLLMNAWAWLEKNLKLVVIVVVAVAVVGSLLAYSNWSARQERIAAGKELSRAIYLTGGPANGQSAVAELQKVATLHSGSDAAAQAVLLAANTLFQEGKYAESQAEFERFRKEYSNNPLVVQAIYGSGKAAAAQGKWDDASQAFKLCVDRHAGSAVTAYAKFSLARAYEQQGQPDLALPLYQDVLREGSSRSVLNEAMQRVEALSPALPPATTVEPPPAPQTNGAGAQP